MSKPDVKKTSDNDEARPGRFKKGMRRPKGAGRKPGSLNKITRTIKEAIEAAFNELQLNPKTKLAAWAKKNNANLREFYKIAARFIPLEVKPSAPDSGIPFDQLPLMEQLDLARRVSYIMYQGANAADELNANAKVARLAAPVEPVLQPAVQSAEDPAPHSPTAAQAAEHECKTVEGEVIESKSRAELSLDRRAEAAEHNAIWGPSRSLPRSYAVGGRRRPRTAR